MNKKTLAIVVAILLTIGGGVAYLLSSSSEDTPPAQTQQTQDTSPQNTATPERSTTIQQPGAYINYSASAIADTPGTKLLFFHAPWCPQCRDLESDIKSTGVPTGTTIIKVDYDTSQSLRQKYGVTLQTTIVRIDDQGELVSKFVAYDDPSVKSIVENLL